MTKKSKPEYKKPAIVRLSVFAAERIRKLLEVLHFLDSKHDKFDKDKGE